MLRSIIRTTAIPSTIRKMTSHPTTKKLYKIGMIGGGTVGGGVYELICKYYDPESEMVISKICVSDINKSRTFVIDPLRTTYTTDPATIYNDPTIDCIVEVMGGITIAKDIIMNGIAQRKSIVTANKALLAESLDEINDAIIRMNATRNMDHHDPIIGIGYEASVCGGIPIIHILQTCYKLDDIYSIRGIMNGTTNYMLSEMDQNGSEYHDVLKKAQELGYAETDPTADVEGHDVRSKIAILTKLAYGITITDPVAMIPCQGISSITKYDILYGQKYGYKIKLLGISTLDNNTLRVYVTPTMIPTSHMLSQMNGSQNCVVVGSNNMNSCTYAGPGAGRYPTANSIVSDIIRIYDQTMTLPSIAKNHHNQHNIIIDSNYTAMFYIRISIDPDDSKILLPLMQQYMNEAAANVSVQMIECDEVNGILYYNTTTTIDMKMIHSFLYDTILTKVQSVATTTVVPPRCHMIYMPIMEP